MTLSANTIFEVRASVGADTNGGGFVSTASGTDYSQQNTAQYSGTNLASTSGTTNPSIVTSATHNFVAADVGNLIQITAGTNWTTGFYQIVSVAGNAATLDRAVGTSATLTSGTFAVGGALATIGKAVAAMSITGMQTYVKATATYSISTGITTVAQSNSSGGIARIIGYTTTRGDLGQPTIQATASINAFSDAQGSFRFENFILDGNTGTGSQAFVLSGATTAVYNCNIKNWSSNGVNMTGAMVSIIQSSITGCGAGIFSSQAGALIKNCFINANTGTGISIVGQGVTITGNIISNNSGASTDGVQYNNNYSYVKGSVCNNVFYANGRNGLLSTGNYYLSEISNNIFVNNGAFGLSITQSPSIQDVLIHNNAYYNNTSGARSGPPAGTGDVTLTGVPFVNAASLNFALNNTAGQGAACRAVGYPGVLQQGGTGYIDIGALQHQDPASGGLLVNPGMTGGCSG